MRARRGWAWPLVPLYAAGLAVKDGLRAAGVLRTRKLGWPVVSVGSLSAGGAGKTPVVIALAGLLQERGWGVDVLSRGYGRSGRGVERVDGPAEKQVLRCAQDDNVLREDGDAAGRFGDEPVLIARRAGVEVWVGADRFAAGMAAEGVAGRGLEEGQRREADSSAALRNDKAGALRNDNPKKVHLLDDGFQHRGLGRPVDVVLVTEEDLEDALLPAGNRREGLRALRRADVVVVREEERAQVEGRVREFMRDNASIWIIRRQISFPETTPILNTVVPTYGHVVFSAIARPENFVAMLCEAGVNALEVISFADHHAYTDGDMNHLLEGFEESVGNGFITTEKDAVKLTEAMRKRLEAVGPVCVARLEAVFVDAATVVKDLEARIG